MLLATSSLFVLSAAPVITPQHASAQDIAGLGSVPSNQTSQSTNQTEGIIFQGNSILVMTIGNMYNEDRWQSIDNYAASGFDIKSVIHYKSSEDNNTLRTDRAFVILEKGAQ
jgi:hypothetical protein